MNDLNIERKTTDDLAVALNQSVEAAVDLKMPEAELVAWLLERLHSKRELDASICTAPTLSVSRVKMFNPEAGP